MSLYVPISDGYSYVPSLTKLGDAPGDFNPLGYPNLRCWYKASDFDHQLHGTDVVNWLDVAGGSPPLHLAAISAAVGARPTVNRNSINSTMTSVNNLGGTHRGLKSSFGAAYLTSKTIWTWFGVVYNNSLDYGIENNCCGLVVTGSSSEIRFQLDTLSRFQLTYANVAAYSSHCIPPLDKWHYIVVVNNSGTVTHYVDSVSRTFLTTPGTPLNTPLDIALCDGVFAGTNCHYGNIAEVGLYDRALSATEVAGLHTYLQRRYALA